MKITGEEYLWDCIKENITNIWVTLLLPWMENVLENTCSWSCWICCFGFVLEKGQNKATLTLKSRTWWDSCCCTLPRGDYSIIFSMHKLHLIKLSPTWPQLLKTVITPLSSPIKIIFSNHSSTLATHLGLEDKGWDSENSGRGETGCNKLCCWGDAAPTLSLQVELPKYNGFCITNHEFQAVCYEYMKSRSGCSVVEQDKGIFARFEPRYLYSHRCCRVSSQGHTSKENMPTSTSCSDCFDNENFPANYKLLPKKASRIQSGLLGLTSDSCFFLLHELLSSKHWAVILATEV